MIKKSSRNRAGNLIYRSMKDTTLLRIFILPVILLLLVMNVFALLWSLILSFSDYSAKRTTIWGKNPEMIGVENYSKILTDPKMWRKFITTAKFVVMAVGSQMILGFGIALLLHQTNFFGKGFLTTLLILPMTMSPVIVGLMWKLFYNPNWGMFNYLLGLGKIDWTSDPARNIYSVVIADVWMWTHL